MVERNDPGWPLASLIAAALCGWGAAAYGRLVGGASAALSVVQIGLVAFSVLFLVYGIIGLVAVWLEGRELRPGFRLAGGGRLALAVGVLGVVALVAGAGLFAGFIVRDQQAGTTHPGRDGLLAGGIFLLGALLVILYRRYFMDDLVVTDDERSEVPW